MNESNEFVEACRAEWRRLGVPERDAEEMAGDLAADLAAADADGTSVEGFLGSSASDPRGFAASWAAARGVIPVPALAPGPAAAPGGERRGRAALVAFTVIAAVVFVAAVLLLATGEPRITLLTSGTAPKLPGASFTPPASRTLASGAAPIEWVLLAFSALALAFCGWLWSRRAHGAAHPRTAASVAQL